MVQHVESLRDELEPDTFSDRNDTAYTQIRIPKTRAYKRIAAQLRDSAGIRTGAAATVADHAAGPLEVHTGICYAVDRLRWLEGPAKDRIDWLARGGSQNG